RALISRYEQAKQIQTRRREKETALDEIDSEREALIDEIVLHTAHKNEMTSFFGVETLADVRHALKQVGERDRLTKELDKLERQIIAEMQQDTLERALTGIADADLVELQREQAELSTRIENL